MVPFWRRRLLAATLPLLALATLAAVVLGLIITQRARRPGLVLDLEAMGIPLALAMPHVAVVLLVPLLLARVTHRDVAGPGLVAAALLLSVWMIGAVFVLTVAMGMGLGVNVNRSPWLLSIGLLNSIAVPWIALRRSGQVVPRTDRAARLCTTASCVGGVGLCIAIPLFAIQLSLRDPESPVVGSRRALAGLSLATYAGLALCSAGLTAATACRALTQRHAPYHARHCHECGYDLLGVETYTCPECDHPIATEQSDHLAQLASNGSHSTSSSPTAST